MFTIFANQFQLTALFKWKVKRKRVRTLEYYKQQTIL